MISLLKTARGWLSCTPPRTWSYRTLPHRFRSKAHGTELRHAHLYHLYLTDVTCSTMFDQWPSVFLSVAATLQHQALPRDYQLWRLALTGYGMTSSVWGTWCLYATLGGNCPMQGLNKSEISWPCLHDPDLFFSCGYVWFERSQPELEQKSKIEAWL